MKSCTILLLLATCAAFVAAQDVRTYKDSELFEGQICADDGPAWENLFIGSCPQGYHGIRNFAKANGLLPQALKTAATKPAKGKYRLTTTWPFCDPCKSGQTCFEFKPGVAKCIVPASSSKQYLSEGETCLDFSNGNKKWKPKTVNPVLFGKSCEWPQFSCDWDASSNNGVYKCERIRNAGQSEPVKKCYRAAGSRWWGGTDQWYTWENGKYIPCGGPNPDYKSCSNFANCKDYAPWPIAG